MSKRKQSHEKAPSKLPGKFETVLVAACAVLFYLHARHFKFIQDDSFITFRYIKNFAAGNGLVFNIGERVEGYTTFLWTALLALPAKLGFDLITSSQQIGVLFAIVTIILLYRLSKEISPSQRPFGYSLIAVILFTANSACAYWAISGMETALFTFLLLLGARTYLKEIRQQKYFGWTPLVFVLLSFTRPEGIFLFGLTMLHYLFDMMRTKEHRALQMKRCAAWALLYIVPVGAFTLWRLFYYGYLFPNTFYAKAGISQEYFQTGINYFWFFAQKDLLWGAMLALPITLLLARRRSREILYLIFIVIPYILYVIVVGGDVLPAFRFFIPILPLVYLLVQEFFIELHTILNERRSLLRHALLFVALWFAYATYKMPYDYVREYWMKENGLVEKMTAIGEWIKTHSSPGSSFAASTIGAIGYYSDVTLIDMLGLTDETIAHHPEKMEGVASGWRERNYNATYVLARKPEYICFSTGIKPSAYAERALFLKDEFRRMYYPFYFHLAQDVNSVMVMYKRSETPNGDSSQSQFDNSFINYYYDGMNLLRSNQQAALTNFEKAVAIAPKNFALGYEAIAGVYRSQKKQKESLANYERAVAIDPRMIESHIILGIDASDHNNFDQAKKHFEAITRFDPEYALGWSLLGQACLATGEPAKAKEYFIHALTLAPNDAQTRRALAQVEKK